MAADAPLIVERGEARGLIESKPIRHKRCRCDNAALVRLIDGAIDTMSESEIVGIDDETSHAKSLAGVQETGPSLALRITASLTVVLCPFISGLTAY